MLLKNNNCHYTHMETHWKQENRKLFI